MTLPGIGPLPLSGFQRPAMLVFGLVPLALLGSISLFRLDVDVACIGSPRRIVPQSLWRHIPIAVSVLCLALLTVALATPTHDMRYRATAPSSCW